MISPPMAAEVRARQDDQTSRRRHRQSGQASRSDRRLPRDPKGTCAASNGPASSPKVSAATPTKCRATPISRSASPISWMAPRIVVRYFKNERLGFSVTYYESNRPRQYFPDLSSPPAPETGARQCGWGETKRRDQADNDAEKRGGSDVVRKNERHQSTDIGDSCLSHKGSSIDRPSIKR